MIKTYYSWMQNGNLVHKRNEWIAREIMKYEVPAAKLIDRYIFFHNNIRVHQTIHMPPAEMWMKEQFKK